MSRATMEALLNKALNDNASPITLDGEGYALVHVAGVAVNVEYDETRDRLYLYASLPPCMKPCWKPTSWARARRAGI